MARSVNRRPVPASRARPGFLQMALSLAGAAALVLLLGSLLAAGLTLSGRSLPRTLPETSRLAVLGGSLVGGVLGVAMLIGGTPR